MNILKSSNSKIKTLCRRKKSKSFKTHMRNFNKQYFDVQQEQLVITKLSAKPLYQSTNLVFFMRFLVMTVPLYILTSFFFERMTSFFWYDIWLDICTLLDQSGYWRAQQVYSGYNFFYDLENIKNNVGTSVSLKETFSKIKILDFIIID